MAFGTRRIIIEAIWKQGRKSEAKIYYLDTLHLIEKSKDSKFGKYAWEETRLFEELLAELEAWKLD
jgi:hypothetical protein